MRVIALSGHVGQRFKKGDVKDAKWNDDGEYLLITGLSGAWTPPEPLPVYWGWYIPNERCLL